jgi:hypothetical protein
LNPHGSSGNKSTLPGVRRSPQITGRADYPRCGNAGVLASNVVGQLRSSLNASDRLTALCRCEQQCELHLTRSLRFW